jgi:hypothetical protein
MAEIEELKKMGFSLWSAPIFTTISSWRMMWVTPARAFPTLL